MSSIVIFYIILLVADFSHELEDYTNIREKRVFGTKIARVLKIPATTPIDPLYLPSFQYRQRYTCNARICKTHRLYIWN